MRAHTKLLFAIGVLVGATTFSATKAHAARGVAFIHGTGSHWDAYNEYFTAENVDSVRAGLSNSGTNTGNYVVINCDFTKYMWDAGAAGCVATALTSFIAAKGIGNGELTIETHSNGSNVLRWIMSNPTWDARYPNIISKIRWVNAIAATSLGTPLANAVINGNIFESALGWLTGYANDAVRMQQTSWMASYNASWLFGTAGRPALPKGFWNVVGTDVDSSPFDGDSWCGGSWGLDGYAQSVALDNIQNIYLNSCSDGFVDCSSQQGAGTTWFQDKSRTADAEPLSHNQSRRKCFNIDGILRSDV